MKSVKKDRFKIKTIIPIHVFLTSRGVGCQIKDIDLMLRPILKSNQMSYFPFYCPFRVSNCFQIGT
jgi:hypothetical protein